MLTSHRRNSAFSRPSPCRVMRPVTSACALMVFQFWNCGAASMLMIFSMIGGLIDRREQSAALEVVGDDLGHADADLVIRRACPPTKFGIAIGSGAKSPSVTCSSRFERLPRRQQRAGRRTPAPPFRNDLPAGRAERHARQSTVVGHCFGSCSIRIDCEASVFAIETGVEVFPFARNTRRGSIVRLALDDRAQRALLIDADSAAAWPATPPGPAGLRACRRASAGWRIATSEFFGRSMPP